MSYVPASLRRLVTQLSTIIYDNRYILSLLIERGKSKIKNR